MSDGSLVRLKSKQAGGHLTCTDSTILNDYILTCIRRAAGGVKLSQVIEIGSKRSLDEALSVATVVPMDFDRWVFHVKVSGLRGSKNSKALSDAAKVLPSMGTGIVWYETRHYRDYKSIEDLNNSLNARYISYLTRDEMSDMLGDVEIGARAKSFLLTNYSNDVESPLRLREEILDGAKVQTASDVTATIGVSVGTIQSFVIKLAKYPSSIGKGKNGHPAGADRRLLMTASALAKNLGYPALYRRAKGIVDDIRAVKMLYIAGEVYTSIPKNLSGVYSDRRLYRYNRFMKDINSIPLTSLNRLVVEFGREKGWYSDLDMLEFLHRWFSL